VLIIDPASGSATLGPAVAGANNKWYGGVLAPDGKIYAIPQSLTSTALVIDPKSSGSWPDDLYYSQFFNKF